MSGVLAGAVSARPVGRARVVDALRLYWQVARMGYRRWATYRAATLAGVFTNSVFGLMRAYVLIALFVARPHAGGYSERDAILYVWLTQGAIMTVYMWGWNEIALRIRSGDIVSDLRMPVDFQLYWLAQDLGRALYHAVFRGLPPLLLGVLLFRLALPADPALYALFVLSLTLAVCLSFALRFIVNVAAFWLIDYRGVSNLVTTVWTFFSGFVVPLALFPGAWRTLAEGLPFAGMIQTPIDLFLGQYRGMDVLLPLGLQVAWTALLLVIGRWMFARATARLVVQGG